MGGFIVWTLTVENERFQAVALALREEAGSNCSEVDTGLCQEPAGHSPPVLGVL